MVVVEQVEEVLLIALTLLLVLLILAEEAVVVDGIITANKKETPAVQELSLNSHLEHILRLQQPVLQRVM